MSKCNLCGSRAGSGIRICNQGQGFYQSYTMVWYVSYLQEYWRFLWPRALLKTNEFIESRLWDGAKGRTVSAGSIVYIATVIQQICDQRALKSQKLTVIWTGRFKPKVEKIHEYFAGVWSILHEVNNDVERRGWCTQGSIAWDRCRVSKEAVLVSVQSLETQCTNNAHE